MIRLVFVLRRKAGMSLGEFQQYWSSAHGPMVAKHATTLDIDRYVQVHTLDDPLNAQMAAQRGKMEPPYDGVAEVWWRNREALVASTGSEAGKAAMKELLEDEARFIDLPNSPLWLAYEYPQINPPEVIVAREHSPLVKIYFCLGLPANQTLEQVQLYWRTNHGPTIRGMAPAVRMKRYIQVHRFEDPIEQQLRASRGTRVAPYYGHAEAWVDRADFATGGPEARRAMEIAIEDEAKFINFEKSAIWIAKERVFIDRS